MLIRGRTINAGYASGTTHVLDTELMLERALNTVANATDSTEEERFNSAISQAEIQLDRLKRQLRYRMSEQDLAILDTHAALLRDPKFVGRVAEHIKEDRLSAEAAVATAINFYHGKFTSSTLSMIRDKALDVHDVGRRLLQCLSSSQFVKPESMQGTILVASNVLPTDIIHYAHLGIAGIIAESCGHKSHTAILARGLGIPMISGIGCATQVIPNKKTAYLDAHQGVVVCSPSAAEQHIVSTVKKAIKKETSDTVLDIGEPVTSDGNTVTLLSNLSDLSELHILEAMPLSGVGLFRTEFLYMDRRTWPSEEESFQIYETVSRSVGTKELNIRLADFGAEKCPLYADIPINRNPSLGLRGMRLLLRREDVLRPQLLALARLARHRPVTVILPMLDSGELLDKSVTRFCKIIGCSNPDSLPFAIGAMVECPSAALTLESYIERVGSLFIGLNDLAQYTLAADRDDECVEEFHDPLHPSVIRLAKEVVETAQRYSKPVTVCSDLLNDVSLFGVLLALGIRRFSIYPSDFTAIMQALSEVSVAELEGVMSHVLTSPGAEAVRKCLKDRVCHLVAGPAATYRG